MFKLGIIGANGNMGFKRILALRNKFGDDWAIRHLYLCDLSDTQIAKSDLSLPFSNDQDYIVEAPEITHVILSTPNSKERDDLLLKLVENNKHVLVEKPISLRYDIIERVFQIAEKNGVKVKTAYNIDYFPSIQLLLKEKNKIGKPTCLELIYGNGWFNPENQIPEWILSPVLERGVDYFMGCHTLSLLWMFAGNQKVISSNIIRSRSNEKYPFDISIINVELESMMFTALVSWVMWKNTFELKIMGNHGMGFINSLVKYIKYGQGGEKVNIVQRKKGTPLEEQTVFTYDNVDKMSADLEYLDLEMADWLKQIEDNAFSLKEEREKNLFIDTCLKMH